MQYYDLISRRRWRRHPVGSTTAAAHAEITILRWVIGTMAAATARTARSWFSTWPRNICGPVSCPVKCRSPIISTTWLALARCPWAGFCNSIPNEKLGIKNNSFWKCALQLENMRWAYNVVGIKVPVLLTAHTCSFKV